MVGLVVSVGEVKYSAEAKGFWGLVVLTRRAVGMTDIWTSLTFFAVLTCH